MDDTRLPVIVISGFLGAGKTTLLKKILATPELANSMLIVNEIGEIGIDHQLFERSDDETVLLDNGCMCCQLRGDLQALLVDLGMKRQRGEIPSFDRVFIETSGLAEPGPIAQTLYGDGPLARDYRLAHVVTLLDPLNPDARDAAPVIAESQVAAADLIVISKADQASAAQIDQAAAWGASLNSYARQIVASHGDMDIALLAQATPFDHPVFRYRPRKLFGNLEASTQDDTLDTPQGKGAYLAEYREKHPEAVGSFALSFSTPPSRRVFDLFMNTLLRLRGEDLLRVKGVVSFEEEITPYLIQGVCHVYDQPMPLQRPDKDASDSVLVFIGRNLSKDQIENYWQALEQLASSPV